MKKAHFAFRAIAIAALATAWSNCFAATPVTVEEYAVTMHLRVPRIYDNECSLGKRKYQSQTLKGSLVAIYDGESDEPVLEFTYLENRTHKVGGKCVTYNVATDRGVWCLIGDNAKDKFKTSSVSFYIDADPSYNIGEDEPDNTLLLTLSGSGSHKRLSGYAAGQIGCGCRAYGHKSPTRIMGVYGEPGEVTDIASVYGSWSAKLKRTYTRCIERQEQAEE